MPSGVEHTSDNVQLAQFVIDLIAASMPSGVEHKSAQDAAMQEAMA